MKHVLVLVGFMLLFVLLFTWPYASKLPDSVTLLGSQHVDLQNPPQAIDGVTLGQGVTVLLTAQTNAKERGVYNTNPWYLSFQPAKPQTFIILQGNTYGNTLVTYNSDTQSYTLPEDSQVVTDETLQGDGTLSLPLGLAVNGASTGDVMTYSATGWQGSAPTPTEQSAGKTVDSWDTGATVGGWAAVVGTMGYDGRVFNSSGNVGDSYEWTMGSNGTVASIPGQFYRFRFNLDTGQRGIANALVDNTLFESIDTYSGNQTFISKATPWYQATNTSMKLTITITGKNASSSSNLVLVASLGIDILSDIS